MLYMNDKMKLCIKKRTKSNRIRCDKLKTDILQIKIDETDVNNTPLISKNIYI